MSAKISAGLVMYRLRDQRLEFFIAHPGGPFFRHRDADSWSIPKGEVGPSETLLEAAIREFKEEVSLEPREPFIELGSIRQKSGKRVYAWAFEGDWDSSQPIRSNLFQLEFPPGSGQFRSFPEVDRAGFYGLNEARRLLKAAQFPLLERLEAILRENRAQPPAAPSQP